MRVEILFLGSKCPDQKHKKIELDPHLGQFDQFFFKMPVFAPFCILITVWTHFLVGETGLKYQNKGKIRIL